MKKTKGLKTIISLVMAVMMLFSTTPITALAATCTTKNNHSIECGDIGSWFVSIDKLQEYVSSVTDEWVEKVNNGEITWCEYKYYAPCGYECWSCAYCGKWTGNYKYRNVTNKTCQWDAGVVTKPASCTTTGTKKFTCTVCNSTKTETIPKIAHSYKSVVTAPTCTAKGYTTKTCSVCGYTTKTNYKDALGHNYKDNKVDPTCTEDGYTEHVCQRCGYTEKCETLKATGHIWNCGSITKAATCTSTGVKTYKCTKCNETKTETIPKTAHSYVSTVTEPTCTTGGYTTHACTVCGYSYKDSDTLPTGHSYACLPQNDKTHINICLKCNITTTENCTIVDDVCTKCGASYSEDTPTPTPTPHTHTWNSGVVTKPASCTTTGTKTYTCTGCGETKSVLLRAIGHSYSKKTVEPTCTTDGYTEYTCTRCNASYRDDITAKLGHDCEIIAETAPFCTYNGVKVYACKRCDYSYREVVKMTGHEIYSKTTVTKAEIGKDGSIDESTYCSFCKLKLTSNKTKINKVSSVALNKENFTCNGKVKTPAVVVKDSSGRVLIKNTDYTVSYPKGRKAVGTYSVKITFKGNYTGSKTLKFKILPKGTKLSSVKPKKQSVTVKWKKQAKQITGYQIQYSTSKKFKSAKLLYIKKTKTTKTTVKKLKKGKKYYFRIRTYKVVNGKKYCSSWSKSKSVKIIEK